MILKKRNDSEKDRLFVPLDADGKPGAAWENMLLRYYLIHDGTILLMLGLKYLRIYPPLFLEKKLLLAERYALCLKPTENFFLLEKMDVFVP